MFEFIITILFLVVDQASKFIFDAILKKSIVIIPSFFSVEMIYNTGASWSILENQTFLLILAGILCLWFLYIMRSTIGNSKMKTLGYALLNAGILGNLIDRICLGHVRDFLSFQFFDYSFPVFNFADVWIVLGTMCLIYLIWKEEKSHEKNNSRNRRKNQAR